MRISKRTVCAVLLVGVLSIAITTAGHAVCRTMEASHNGTDMFHETGATGAAINKLLIKVDQLKAEKGLARVRMGRVRTKCGPWFTKYMLPHRHCVAKARVCY